MKKFLTLILLILAIAFMITLSTKAILKHDQVAKYDPQINPSDFSTNITNPLFTLPIGRKLTYEEQTTGGSEKNVIEIANEKRIIMGVETIVYRDKVWKNNQLIEDTKDYLAQDKDGNVWYFGEEVNNYESGKLVDHKGSWIAGNKGALPGIWIKSQHFVGDSYRQEYYQGEAEDMTNVVAVNKTVKTKKATYKGCVKMYDWTPLEPSSQENKYYCPEVGALVVSEHIGQGDRMELIDATPKLP